MILSLAACKVGGGNSGNNQGDNTDDNQGGTGDTGDTGDIADGYSLVFSGSEYVTIVSNSDDKGGNLSSLAIAIKNKAGRTPPIRSSVEGATGNLIILGDSSSALTEKALELLDARIKRAVRSADDEDAAEIDTQGFIVYADGGSVAVVWSDWRLEAKAIDYFKENYVLDSSLVLKDGYTKSVILSMEDYLAERGEAVKAASWEEFAEQIPAEYRDPIVAALKNLYSIYTPDMVTWLANLYDPELGMFYTANSVRDNLGYGPNVEDTQVALSFLMSSGMAEMRGDWLNVLTEEQKKVLGDTVYNMQDPDGFFYHWQWPKEMIEELGAQSRITRDIGNATYLLKKLGIEPKYTLPGNVDSSVEQISSSVVGRSTAVAVSKVVLVADDAPLSQFASIEAFQEEMDAMEARVLSATDPDQRAFEFYWVGNRFQSITEYLDGYKMVNGQKVKSELELAQRDMLIAFFEKYQNPENGAWSEIVCYNATNSIHKIAAVYTGVGVKLNYVDKMIDTIFEILRFNMEDEARTAINGVDIYNAWSSLHYIYENVEKYGDGTTEERLAKVAEYKARVYREAPELIAYTTSQIVRARHDDGSFSYSLNGMGGVQSMGLKTRPLSVSEGDINGNAMAMLSTVRYIILGLGLDDSKMPLFFTEAECNTFVNILANMGPTIKSAAILDEEQFFDFEDYIVGDVPVDFNINLAGAPANSGHYANVVESGNKNHGKVFEYAGTKRQGATGANAIVKIEVPNNAVAANVAILEMDMFFSSEGSDLNATLIESSIKDYRDSKQIHFLYFTSTKDGRIVLKNSDKLVIAELGGFDEVIDFRYEYYWEAGVYKLYINDKFVASGNETYNMTPHQAARYVTLRTSYSVNSKYWIDNVHFTRVEKKFIDPTREILDEKIYNFNASYLGDSIAADGDYAFTEVLEGNKAFESNGANLAITPYNRSPIANATTLDFDLAVPTYKNGEVTALKFYNENGALLWQTNLGVDANGKIYLQNGSEKITTEALATDNVRVRAEALWGAGVGKSDCLFRLFLDESDEPVFTTLTMCESPAGKIKVTEVVIDALTTERVLYDNLACDITYVSYAPSFNYPTVEPGEDTGRFDFEDYNVGGELPDRISGDGAISTELDGSDRFLQIVDDSRTNSYETVIKMFNKDSKANSTVIELDAEYLTAVSGILHTFVLVDTQGNTEDIFYLKQEAAHNTLAIRPYSVEEYSASYHGTNPDKWLWSAPTSNLDIDPSIVSRQMYINGMLTGKAGGSSSVTIRLEIDWTLGTVKLSFNEKYNGYYKQYGESVYRMSLKNVDSLKIVSSDFGMSVLNIDNLKAENYFSTPATQNGSSSFGFDDGTIGKQPNGYINNGAEVKPGNGSVTYQGTGDRYLDIVGGSEGTNPTLTFPTYTADSVVPNMTAITLDIELDKLSAENTVEIALLDSEGKPVVGIALLERDGAVMMYHYDGYFSSRVRPLYLAADFAGGAIPLTTTESTSGGDITRFTLAINYIYASGIMQVSLPATGSDTPIYEAICTPVSGVSAFTFSVVESVEADVNLYSVTSANVNNVTAGNIEDVEPSVKDFESGYTTEDVEWDCTNSANTGETSQSATNIYTEDGVRVVFEYSESYSNSHGASAEILTEAGNSYLRLEAGKKNYSSDKEHNVYWNTENCVVGEHNAYVVEMKLRVDSSNKKADFLRLKLANDSKKFVYLATGRNGDIVTLNNIAIGPTDFWIDLRIEYYPEENVMKMYSGGKYKGEFSDTFNISAAYTPHVSALGGAINEAAIFISNSADERYGGIGVGLDDLRLYTANIDYASTSLGKEYEDFETRSESYDKTLSDGNIGTSVKFGSSMSFEYGGTTNGAGTTVSVETKPDGNRYVHFDINKRVNSSTDGSYTPIFYTQNLVENPNAYLVEMTTKLSTQSTGGFNMLLVAGKVRGELHVRTASGAVMLDGIRLASVDEWFDLRLEYYPAEDVIQVFVRTEGADDFRYMGDIARFTSSTITDANGATLLNVGALGGLDRVTCSLPNTAYEYDLYLDNVAVSSASLEFVDLTDTLKYKLSYIVDGAEYFSELISSGATVTLPAAPEKNGYTFEGWFLDNGKFTKPFTPDYFLNNTLRADVKVYAKLTETVLVPETYTVTFIVDGEEYHSATITEGQSVVVPTAPEKDGHTFDGWFFENGEALTEGYIVTADVRVYAEFSEIVVPEEYTVVFIVDGEEYHSATVTEGQRVVLPTSPKKDGFTFDGWFFENGEVLAEDYAVTADVRVYARFSEIKVPDPIDPPIADGDEPVDTEEESEAPDIGDVDEWKI